MVCFIFCGNGRHKRDACVFLLNNDFPHQLWTGKGSECNVLAKAGEEMCFAIEMRRTTCSRLTSPEKFHIVGLY
jgi:hypothetical protein